MTAAGISCVAAPGRHGRIRDGAKEGLAAANLAPHIEAGFSEAQEQPDALAPAWPRSRPAAFDVALIASLCKAWMAKSALKGQASAELGWEGRAPKHSERCQERSGGFLPLPGDTLGAWPEESLQAIAQIAEEKQRALEHAICACMQFGSSMAALIAALSFK